MRFPRYPSEYAIANKIDHSPTVYLREDHIVGPLDRWLAQAFAPERIEQSLATLADAQPSHNPEIEVARRMLTEQNRRLATYRQALEAGTDPQLVAAWTSQVLSEKQVTYREPDRHTRSADHRARTNEPHRTSEPSLTLWADCSTPCTEPIPLTNIRCIDSSA